MKSFLTPLQFVVFNAVLFQALWFAAIVGQNDYLWLSVLLCATHALLSPDLKQDVRMAAAPFLLGVTMDYSLMHLGVFVFQPSGFPLWLLCIWALFSVSLRYSFAWLANKPVIFAVLLGAVGGTLSYWSASKLGAVTFGYPLPLSLAIIGSLWAILVPLFLQLVHGNLFSMFFTKHNNGI